jgi:hypothetical protein
MHSPWAIQGRSLLLAGHQIPSEHPVMNPQRRQMRLQWDAMTIDPHISQRGSPSPGRNGPGRTASRTRWRGIGTGGKTTPSLMSMSPPV